MPIVQSTDRKPACKSVNGLSTLRSGGIRTPQDFQSPTSSNDAWFRAAAVSNARKYLGRYASRCSSLIEFSRNVIVGSTLNASLRTLVAFLTRSVRFLSACERDAAHHQVDLDGWKLIPYLSHQS